MRELSVIELNRVAGGQEEAITLPDVVITAKRKVDSNDGGGRYVSFGFGIGAGFILTFSGSGVDAAVGGGLFGHFEIGHADSDEDLQHDDDFVQAKVANVGVGVEHDDGVTKINIGPVTLGSDGSIEFPIGLEGDWGVTVGDNPNFGLNAGAAWMEYVGHNDWFESERGTQLQDQATMN